MERNFLSVGDSGQSQNVMYVEKGEQITKALVHKELLMAEKQWLEWTPDIQRNFVNNIKSDYAAVTLISKDIFKDAAQERLEIQFCYRHNGIASLFERK